MKAFLVKEDLAGSTNSDAKLQKLQQFISKIIQEKETYFRQDAINADDESIYFSPYMDPGDYLSDEDYDNYYKNVGTYELAKKIAKMIK